jgi:D-lactate dehydrogenase
VVVDASSCAEGLTVMMHTADGLGPEDIVPGAGQLRIVDAIEYTAGMLLPKLPAARRLESVALHPTCSSRIAGTDTALQKIAAFAGDEVFVPLAVDCCAFAGDRGMLHPELTESATRAESSELASEEQERGRPFTAYASSNRTCEIGLTRATGRPYRHILEILAASTAD